MTTSTTTEKQPIPRPPWFEMWTTGAGPAEYDANLIERMRRSARNPEMFQAMLRFPPHCIIGWRFEGHVVHGIVVNICWLDMPHPTTGRPRHVIGLRYATNPLQVTGEKKMLPEDLQHVLPAGVEVLGYAPGSTPEIIRALLKPQGLS